MFKTHKSKNKINNKIISNNEEENDVVNDLLFTDIQNMEKRNNIYKKTSIQRYNTVNDDEQYNFDLREFVNSKMKKSVKRPIVKPGHHRSNSTNLYNY